ncbi:hypothetical protein ACU4GA_28075 [Methylobacterium oryzae CBMB20]
MSLDLTGFDGLRPCGSGPWTGPGRCRLIMLAEASRPRPGGPRPRFRRARLPDAARSAATRLMARVRTQVKRKRFTDALRGAMAGLPADGRHRRAHRPAQPPLPRQPSRHALFGDEAARRSNLAALILDIDHFKGTSTTASATRPATRCCVASPSRSGSTTRPIDIVARLRRRGGGGDPAGGGSRRGRRASPSASASASRPWPFTVLRATRTVSVTVSIGVAVRRVDDHGPADMLRRADLAPSTGPRRRGRNRVESQAA